MGLKRRRFTKEFKLQVVRGIEAGKAPAQVAREHEIHPTLISKWQRQHQHDAERAFAGNGHTYTDEARRAELERIVGQLTLENAFLKKSCGNSKHKCARSSMKEGHLRSDRRLYP